MKLPWWLPFGAVPEISPAEFAAWLQDGRAVQVVDARTSVEYRQGTIGAARHAPVTDTPAAIQRLRLDPARPVVVLCLSGHRSRPGVRWLNAQGFQAYSLQGGVMAWRQAGYPLGAPPDPI